MVRGGSGGYLAFFLFAGVLTSGKCFKLFTTGPLQMGQAVTASSANSSRTHALQLASLHLQILANTSLGLVCSSESVIVLGIRNHPSLQPH